MSKTNVAAKDAGQASEPIRVEATIMRTKKSSRWTRELCFHFWASHGGPDCEISEVARQFDIPRTRVYVWADRDGWNEKWRAMTAETDRRLEERSNFKVSEFVSVEQLDRALVSLFIAMTGIVSDGGLEARARPKAERPLVSFKIADYLIVSDRLREMLRREEDRARLAGGAGPTNLPIGINKTDLRLLASLPPEKIRAVRLLADGYLEHLKRQSFVLPGAPPLSPCIDGQDSAATSEPVTISRYEGESEKEASSPDLNGDSQQGAAVGGEDNKLRAESGADDEAAPLDVDPASPEDAEPEE